MALNIMIQITCDHRSVGEAARIIERLRTLYPNGELPEEPGRILNGQDQRPPAPLAPAGGNPADYVDAWLSHLGHGGRKFWKIAAQFALNTTTNNYITFEDLQRVSGIPKESLRSYHRNSYRAIKDEEAPDPMPGTWVPETNRTEYTMTVAVRDKILQLTQNDPD